MTLTPRVSVAVPLYNEQDNVGELVRRVGAVLSVIPGDGHELVVVDDGSTDRTRQRLEDIAACDSRIVVVSLSRNFGHQPALSAAIDHARGDVVVLMDGDMQDPPEVIPQFLDAYARGYDVVYAQRVNRKEPWWLRACYHVFYRLLGSMSKPRLPLDAGDFCLMSRRVVDQLRRSSEFHRYLRGLRAYVGFKQLGVPVERSAREAGASKYSFVKLVSLALDGLFSFSVVPLRFATGLGAIAVALSCSFGVYALWAALFWDQSPRGFTTQILTVVFLSGVNLFFLGVIGEYVGRLYEEAKARPIYVVDRVARAPRREQLATVAMPMPSRSPSREPGGSGERR